MEYLGKVEDACRYIKAESLKLNAAKNRLLKLVVPVWVLEADEGLQH